MDFFKYIFYVLVSIKMNFKFNAHKKPKTYKNQLPLNSRLFYQTALCLNPIR